LKISLGLTSFSKGFNKLDYLTRAKGLKRIAAQTDIVKLIRRWFIFDLVTKRLVSPLNRLESRKKGKFIIEPDSLIDNRLTSEDSDGSHHYSEDEVSVIIENKLGSTLKQDDISVSRDDVDQNSKSPSKSLRHERSLSHQSPKPYSTLSSPIRRV
jgi:hypothetical protein